MDSVFEIIDSSNTPILFQEVVMCLVMISHLVGNAQKENAPKCIGSSSHYCTLFSRDIKGDPNVPLRTLSRWADISEKMFFSLERLLSYAVLRT